MIVYSGKQRGNNFNNGDEALFQDASRPRDSNMFKVRPGLQSDKWKQRETNKDIYVDAAELHGWGQTSVGSGGSFPDGYTMPSLQQDIKRGDPGCIINDDGNIEIIESGTYIIEASCQFIYPSNPSNSVIESVVLARFRDGQREAVTQNQGRACMASDLVMASITGWFSKGGIFNVAAAHNYGSQVTLFEVMNVHKL